MTLKIAVYTIAKNEQEFASRWAECTKEADYRIVADTGSEDRTREILGEHGVSVHKIDVRPWRFDTARNKALALVPEDVEVCISLDMDEIMRPGWRQALEKVWVPGITVFANCRFILAWKNRPAHKIYHERIHHRKLYHWWGCMHERPVWHGPGEEPPRVLANDLWMEQHQDEDKDRTFYLPLMEQAAIEDGSWWKIYYFLAEGYKDSVLRLEKKELLLKNQLENPNTTQELKDQLKGEYQKVVETKREHALKAQIAGSQGLKIGGYEVWPHCRVEMLNFMAACVGKY